MKKPFDFFEQLAIGHQGEDAFSRQYPSFKRTDGRTHDLVCEDTGATMEVKNESRTTEQTKNYFVERWSKYDDWDESNNKPGGPWQSNADHYCFIFGDGKQFVFDTKQFRERADQVIAKERPGLRMVRNNGYFTAGYTLKREYFEDLEQSYIEVD